MPPPPPRPPPPVPKPRSRFSWSSSPAPSQERNSTDEHVQPETAGRNRAHTTTDEARPPVNLPTLESVTDIIITKIPSLAGIAAAIGGSSSPAPSAPPSVDTLTNNIANNIPALADATSNRANSGATAFFPAPVVTPAPNAPAANSPAANTSAASFDRVMSSLAHIPGVSDIFSGADNPMAGTSPSAPPLTDDKTRPHKDASTGDESNSTVLSSWTNQEEADTESSTEEEDAGLSSMTDGTLGGDSANNSPSFNQERPVGPPPPPPRKPSQSSKQKIPRAATIRVSRKKEKRRSQTPQSAVVRASWLDVWKGFRHSVLWVTLDGQLMSLWKKRTDRFSEVLFHVSSITNVKKQDKGRFSVYVKKKHYDFMAHSEEVQEGWVSSLLACRGQSSPAPSELHGPITMKDPRSRAYMALWGHDLWIYPSKDGFQLGVASFRVPLNVASVKTTGKHSLSLITPYKTLSLSVDSSKELSAWVERLSSTIRSALSCSQVALRLWENPNNKVCGDCGAANPDWASINLLLVICQDCAGHHRGLGSNLSKVRSMTMDSKVWTEPLIQLFLAHGNLLANQVWAPVVPGEEQLCPESSNEERSKFIEDKYSRGRYRRVHALSFSPSMMEQRLLQVVCTNNVEETMSLICSGVKVCPTEPQNPSPILLAEKANQAMQIELLRLNEYTDIPLHQPHSAIRRSESTPSGEEEEELHGKLEEDRFLFSMENDSAACDVMDLREVHSVFTRDSQSQEFELVTLNGDLICTADDREGLLTHLLHILKVILPVSVSPEEMGGVDAVSKVRVVEVDRACGHWEAWLLLWEGGVSIHPAHKDPPLDTLRIELSTLSHHEIDSSENIVTMATADRSLSLRFEELNSCNTWYKHLGKALTNHKTAPQRPSVPNQSPAPQRPLAPTQSLSGLYPVIDLGSRGSVPPAIERCISHITAYGLKVEGVYRRCGISSKVTRLVEALMTSPKTAPLESDEQGVLDAGSALKQYVRQREPLVPPDQRKVWLRAADEQRRFKEYRKLLRQLPDDNRATLNALFGHFYMIQVFSQVNKMSAHNLAVVLVPSLFQALNQDLISLTKEFIIHHTLLFLTPDSGQQEENQEKMEGQEVEEEEQITIF